MKLKVREVYLAKIENNLQHWVELAYVAQQFSGGEAALIIDRFSCELLNLCYGYQLTSANGVNYPAVDLVDADRRTAVRVVVNHSSMKVRAIIGSFCEYGLNKAYDQLIIFMPFSQKVYTTSPFESECKANGINLSMLTIRDIIRKIETIDNILALEKIADFIEKEIGATRQVTSVQDQEENRQERNISKSNSDDTPFVFISYSHADIDRVKSIVEAMGRKGMCVWWDQDIEPGTPWDETIGQHLFDCKCVVALVSRNFMDSTACMDEIYVGKEKDKLLMVYLEDLELPPKMYRYMRIQALRFPTGTKDEEICERLSKTELLKGCYLQ